MATEENQKIMLVQLADVAHIKWTLEKGQILRQCRGKLSRRKLEKRLKESGYGGCSRENLRRLEDGVTTYVPLDLLYALSDALNVDIADFIQVFTMNWRSLP